MKLMRRIRRFDPGGDAGFLRRCILELQAVERLLDPRLPVGEGMVDAYCANLFERGRSWGGAILVAEMGDERAGLLTMFTSVPEREPDEPSGSYALIADLVVLPEFRRRRIASALVREAEVIARSSGAPVIRLEVMAGNESARSFYERLGWRDRVVTMEKPMRLSE
jgi:GNAT superfamily N-acetyltransferase